MTALLRQDAPAPVTVFAPPSCAYSVTFPASTSVAEATTDQGLVLSADMVRNGVRFASACIGSAGGSTDQARSDAKTRIAEMAKSLGVQGAILALDRLGSDCGEVAGALGSANGAYRIDAKICVGAASTFIAEAIYPAAGQDPAIQRFLSSVKTR